MSYPAEAMKNLAQIVSLRNRGIKYVPEFNATNITQIWLNRKLEQAPTNKARKQIFKYAVEEADLDNNPDT
jgi:hypothetical protein